MNAVTDRHGLRTVQAADSTGSSAEGTVEGGSRPDETWESVVLAELVEVAREVARCGEGMGHALA